MSRQIYKPKKQTKNHTVCCRVDEDIYQEILKCTDEDHSISEFVWFSLYFTIWCLENEEDDDSGVISSVFDYFMEEKENE